MDGPSIWELRFSRREKDSQRWQLPSGSYCACKGTVLNLAGALAHEWGRLRERNAATALLFSGTKDNGKD